MSGHSEPCFKKSVNSIMVNNPPPLPLPSPFFPPSLLPSFPSPHPSLLLLPPSLPPSSSLLLPPSLLFLPSSPPPSLLSLPSSPPSSSSLPSPLIYRCSKSASSSQISIFLEEPTTCTYVLTVEAAFLCLLLEETDEYGLFNLKSATEGTGLGFKEAGLDESRSQSHKEGDYDDMGNPKTENLDPDNEDLEYDNDQSGGKKKPSAKVK
jgi:hypothetical protein